MVYGKHMGSTNHMLHLPQKSPSFVGKYPSTMVRIWVGYIYLFIYIYIRWYTNDDLVTMTIID